MLTNEKYRWIKKNLRRGDLKKIYDLLGNVDYVVIVAVLNKRLWGAHGEKIINTAVDYLEERNAREKAESEKYSALLDA